MATILLKMVEEKICKNGYINVILFGYPTDLNMSFLRLVEWYIKRSESCWFSKELRV